MEKKYRYDISCSSGEGYTFGTIDLTEREAAIAAYAMNQCNWNIEHYEPFSGECWIDVDHPQEIEG